MSDHERIMIKLFESLRYRHDLFQVFADFLELGACAISNSVDLYYYQKREKRYLEIMKKYSKNESNIFPKILAHLVQALEDEPDDILGRLFMQMEISSKWTGQFFTPMSICHAMTKMTLGDVDKSIEEKGYFTVNEPACGGGATIIGMAKALKVEGYNYQKVMKVVAQDIDVKSVHMSYLQLSLLGIDATILRGDTLALKFDRDVWRTPNNILQWARRTGKPTEEIGEPKYEQLALF